MRTLFIALALASFTTVAHAQFSPEKLTPMGEKIEAAVKGDVRTAEEKARDAERKPRQTLEFFGLKDDMRVVELVPSGGYFTKMGVGGDLIGFAMFGVLSSLLLRHALAKGDT